MNGSAAFRERPRDANGVPLDGWNRCRCGGRYTLDERRDGTPIVLHNVPTCARYDAVESDEDAIRFSEQNRAACLS